MKLFVSSLILSLVLGAYYCASIKREEYNVAVAFIEQKCKRNTHSDDAFSELLKAREELPNCLEAVGRVPINPLQEYTQYCEVVEKDGYYKCFENLVKKVVPCLAEDEDYFPNFVLTSFNASIEEFCAEDGFRRIGELINNIESSSCRNSISQELLLQDRCIENLVLFKNFQSNIFTIKKNDLCHDLQFAKGCFIQLVQEQCNEDHSDAADFIFDSYLVPCASAGSKKFSIGSKELVFINTFFLFITVFITFKNLFF